MSRDPLMEALKSLCAAMSFLIEFIDDEDKNTKYLDNALNEVMDTIYYIKDYLDKR